MIVKLGQAARYLRQAHQLTQKQAAELLGISEVYISNIENDRGNPSPELLARYRQLWDVDLYVLAWCLFGDVNKLPKPIREATQKLGEAWRRELEKKNVIRREHTPCSS
jgi:transcriptional regulator with XRE-family HTH domain